MRLCRFLIALGGLFTVACTAPEESYVTDVKHFDPDHTALVKVKNHRAGARGELKLFLRADDRFQEDSLTIKIVTYTPDSLRTEELHRLILPRGGRINALKSVIEIPYRRGVELREQGHYYFALTPTRSVEGIEAVGLLFRQE
ncbi:MAG: hypothetical protein J6A66_01875 [Alistipes sp.]|nr:hypothetical protein [Alistipes sp.]